MGSLLFSRIMGRSQEEEAGGVQESILLCGNALKVSNPSLNLQGCSKLMEAVERNPNITELNLAGCNLSKIDELAEVIKSCQHLQKLVLDGNNIGLARTGISALASAIALSLTLQELDLRNNRIGPSFAAALANALRSARSITFIDLRWNSIGPSGAAAFINLLQKNPVITGIQLAGNGIPQKLLSEIDKLVEDNRSSFTVPRARPHVRHPLEDELQNMPREGMEAIYAGRVGALVEELKNVKSEMERLKKEKDDTRLELATSENQIKAVGLELTEEALLRKYADKEANEAKDLLHSTKQELARAEERISEQDRLANFTRAAHNAALAEAEEREKTLRESLTAAVLECSTLKQQLACSQDAHSITIHSLEEKSRAELQNSMSIGKKIQAEMLEMNEAHAKEVAVIRSELTTEVKRIERERDAALREAETVKSMAAALEIQFTAREKSVQQEKVAAEQSLNTRLAGLRSEMETLQSELEDMRRELVKAKKKHAAEVEEYETALAQQRSMHHRLELAKSDLEDKIFSLTGEKVQLEERNKLADDRERLLEKKLELERLKYSEQASGEISRHIEDKKRLESELKSTRSQLHSTRNQLEEFQADQERRKLDTEKRVLGVETAFIEWTRQQFAGLRSSQTHNYDPYANAWNE